MFQDILVIPVRQGYGVETVGLHELIKDIGTEHHRFRRGHGEIGVIVQLQVCFHHITNEGQSPALTPE